MLSGIYQCDNISLYRIQAYLNKICCTQFCKIQMEDQILKKLNYGTIFSSQAVTELYALPSSDPDISLYVIVGFFQFCPSLRFG